MHLLWTYMPIPNAPMYHSCLHFVESLLGREHKNRSKVEKSVDGQNIYHERQVKELCALHALNNLFQDGSAFTKHTLDSICHSLSPDNLVNPHKSMLGLGNYDVNVLMSALQQKGYEAVWFDKRRDPSSIEFSRIIGLILNIPSEMKFGFLPLPLNRKHWIAIRKIGNIFYNLDSKLESPIPLGKEPELLTYLREQIRCKDKEIFLVMTQDVERNLSWRKDVRSPEPTILPVCNTTQESAASQDNVVSALVHGTFKTQVTNSDERGGCSQTLTISSLSIPDIDLTPTSP